MNENTIKKTSY